MFPGGTTAQAKGCICPPTENGFGKKQERYIIAKECPLHGYKGRHEYRLISRAQLTKIIKQHIA